MTLPLAHCCYKNKNVQIWHKKKNSLPSPYCRFFFWISSCAFCKYIGIQCVTFMLLICFKASSFFSSASFWTARNRFLRSCIRLAVYPTHAYSIRAPNTIKKHTSRYMSIDFMYEILGRDAFTLDIRVVMVSTVVTPRPTLAGAAPRFNQKETQDIPTIKLEGM